MRTLHRHQINEVNEAIEIEAAKDSDSPGGGCHNYMLRYGPRTLDLRYQHGPPAEVGINGITDEALLAVILDRLAKFQEGDLRNRHTALALTHIELGLMYLQERTRDRQRREVENTYEA